MKRFLKAWMEKKAKDTDAHGSPVKMRSKQGCGKTLGPHNDRVLTAYFNSTFLTRPELEKLVEGIEASELLNELGTDDLPYEPTMRR